VTLGDSGMEAECSGLSGAFIFFKARREATPGAWEGPLEEAGWKQLLMLPAWDGTRN